MGLNTANGIINLCTQVDTYVEVLDTQLTALIADKASNLISLGRLCMEQKCTFIWNPGCEPRLWDSEGREIRITVHHYVPYLDPQINSQSYVYQSTVAFPMASDPTGIALSPHGTQETRGLTEAAAPTATGPDDDGADADGGSAPPLPPPAVPPGPPDPPVALVTPPHLRIEHLLTHRPMLPSCPTCITSKMKQKKCFRQSPPTVDLYEDFGEMVTMDFIEAREGHSSAEGDGVALTIYDLGTGYVGAYPVKSRATGSTKQTLSSYLGRRRINCLYTDRAQEFTATALALGIPQRLLQVRKTANKRHYRTAEPGAQTRHQGVARTSWAPSALLAHSYIMLCPSSECPDCWRYQSLV